MGKGTVAAVCAFALLALLSGCAGVQSGAQRVHTATWIPGWGWENLAGIAIAVMASVAALAYMAAALLNDDALRAWAKREAGQLVYSGIILVAAVLLVSNLESALKLVSLASPSTHWQTYVGEVICCNPYLESCVQSDLLAGNRPCHIALATDYLQILYESAALQAYSQLLNYWLYSFMSNITIGQSFTALIDLFNANVRPMAGLSINSEFYGVLFDLSFKTMIFVRVQQVVLEFLWASFFPLMMSMGLVLRTFHFSRKLGGLLVALGLSVYVVLPMFYVLMSGVSYGFMGGWNGGAGYEQNIDYGKRTFGNTNDAAASGVPGMGNAGSLAQTRGTGKLMGALELADICADQPPAPGQVSEQETLAGVVQQQALRALYGNWGEAEKNVQESRFGPNGPIANLAMLLVFTLVTPFIGLMTTLAAFKYFSPLIGGDFEISILSRLI